MSAAARRPGLVKVAPPEDTHVRLAKLYLRHEEVVLAFTELQRRYNYALERECAARVDHERIECAVAEAVRAEDVPDWTKRMLLDALKPRAGKVPGKRGRK